MDISARSSLTAGVSLITASAIVFAPLSVAERYQPVTVPRIAMSDVRLVVSPVAIEAFIDDWRAVLLDGTDQIATVVGLPGQGLIGVADNIVTAWDVLFTQLMDATTNPTLLGSLAVLKSFCVDAFSMLAHNLLRINGVITGTTAQVGELLTTALTGSVRTALLAALNLSNAPLAPASYVGLLNAGIETGKRVVANGLSVVKAVGDAGFDIFDIAADELTFQFDNALGSLGKLMTQLGDASGSSLAKVVVAAVRRLALAPVLAVFNFGSQAIKAVIATAKRGFDAVVGIGSSLAGSTGTTTAAAVAVDSVRVARPAARAAVVRTEKPVAKAKHAAKPAAPQKAPTSGAATHVSTTGHSRRSAQ